MNVKKIMAVLLAVCLFTVCFTSCSKNEEEVNTDTRPVVTMVVKDYGTMTFELRYDMAPNTVCNFISLINSGFYNGLTFHRIISGFMIQGGDPKGNGTGGPDYSIAGEFSDNGFTQNTLEHTRGVLSMARSSDPDSAGSQFFIMHADASYLDGQYAAFGTMLSGEDVLDKIAAVSTDSNDKPLTDVVIESVTVDTFGVTYPDVVKIAD